MKKTLDFDDYKECLLAGWNAFGKQLLFQNDLHKVYTIQVNKLALSRDGMNTLGYGHKDVASDISQWLEPME